MGGFGRHKCGSCELSNDFWNRNGTDCRSFITGGGKPYPAIQQVDFMLGVNPDKLFKSFSFSHVCIAIHGEEKSKEYCRDEKFDWYTELANVACWAGLVAFTTWGTGGMAGFEELFNGLKAGFVAGGLAFFTRLAMKRKLYTKYKK